MNTYFLGIDVSTTASKALVIDDVGHVVASSSHAHLLCHPYPLWSEQDPENWWDAAFQSIRDVLQKVPAEKIACIGLTGQMHGLVALDENGRPVRPAILWNDQRCEQQCHEITELLGEDFLYQHMGGVLIPCFITPKLRWLKQHEPAIYQHIAHILLPKDYVRFRLSGRYVSDVSDASGLGLMDIGERTWSEAIVSALEINRAWLPELCESTVICATVNEIAAAETGLKVGTPIVGGAGDQPAQGIGCGISEADMVSIAVGTSGVSFSVAAQYRPEPQGRLNTFCHAMPNTWFYMGVTMSAAGSLRWFRDEITPHKSYAGLDELAEKIIPGSNGLLFAPYLSGERHPHADALARGAWVGLTVRHTVGHMARSIMEGVAFSLKDTIELQQQQGIKPTSIRLSGGAANSRVWQQIMADVMNIPMVLINSNEGAALGAAILAAVGCQAYPDVKSACDALVKTVNIVEPNEKNALRYQSGYAVYKNLYPILRSSFVELAKFES